MSVGYLGAVEAANTVGCEGVEIVGCRLTCVSKSPSPSTQLPSRTEGDV